MVLRTPLVLVVLKPTQRGHTNCMSTHFSCSKPLLKDKLFCERVQIIVKNQTQEKIARCTNHRKELGEPMPVSATHLRTPPISAFLLMKA